MRIKRTMTPEEFTRWRCKLKLTQDETAKMLGYKDRSSICNFERGSSKVNVRLAMLCQLIAKYNSEILA